MDRDRADHGAVIPALRLEDLPAGALSGRILFLVRALEGGGAQRDAILLANALADAGAPAGIVTLDASGPLADLVGPGVPVLDLGRGGRLRMALAFGPLRAALADSGARAFIASEASGNALTVLASRGLDRRPMIVLREVASARHARRNDPYWQNRLGYRLAPSLYPRADRVLALTKAGRADLIADFRVSPERCIALGTNAVLTPDMAARIAATPRRVEPGLVVAVGRLSPEKGFDTLIDAAARLDASLPFRLVIAGEGPARGALEAQIAALGLEDRVSLPGFTADPVPLLCRAAAFVSSSTHEGFGNAIVEAMACGVPVVASDAPHGPREILGGGRWGRLV
ncbi:MAG: glycosyltransferase, partial [Pseudomonadota bacterium]